MPATTPRSTTSPTTAGEAAASLAHLMSSPVRAGVPAILIGAVTGALAWPGLPAAAWITTLVGLLLLIGYALTVNRTWPVRMDSNAVAEWSNSLDTLVLLALLLGGRGVRHLLVEYLDVPVAVAVGVVGVAATAVAWWAFRRPGSDMAPPPLPLPDGFPADSTAPADRIRAVLHVAGATPGRRIVFADRLPDLASLSDADAHSAMTEMQRSRAIDVRRNDSALTERQRRRGTVQLTESPGTAGTAQTAGKAEPEAT